MENVDHRKSATEKILKNKEILYNQIFTYIYGIVHHNVGSKAAKLGVSRCVNSYHTQSISELIMSQTKQNETNISTKMPYQSPKLTKLGGVNELTEASFNRLGGPSDGGTVFPLIYAS